MRVKKLNLIPSQKLALWLTTKNKCKVCGGFMLHEKWCFICWWNISTKKRI